MLRCLTTSFALFWLATGLSSGATIPLLTVRGVIDPPNATYVLRGLRAAERQRSPAVVLEMDTPGGLMDSMRDIVQGILNSPVPVVVYVAPRGARAASAGAFILMASDVAAMAPQTNVGAAHPVGVSGEMAPDKATNDAAAQLRALAERRGRNVQWAEKAVRQSVSATATEALKLDIIDFVAPTLDSLLKQADGYRAGGKVLRLRGARPEPFGMTLKEQAFHTLANPNITMILFLLAIYGLVAEVTHPGAIFPGVVGSISLILALYSFAVFSLNVAGLLMLLLAVGLFATDLLLPGHGVLSVAGGICFALGGFMLFEDSAIGGASSGLIVSVSLFTTVFFAYAIGAAIRAQKRAVVTGREELVGARGVAKESLDGTGTGMVLIRGEWWRARSEEPVAAGDPVVVTAVDGLTLTVRKET